MSLPDSGGCCRYHATSEDVLGFSNRWYPDGYAFAFDYNMGDDYSMRIFRPEYFIASKLEAFLFRGKGDGRFSTDFEDIVFLLNHRQEIFEEMAQAPPDLKEYLQVIFNKLLIEEHIYEWISAHLDYEEQRRTDYIIGGLLDFADPSKSR